MYNFSQADESYAAQVPNSRGLKMHWSAYEVFSVISGVLLLGATTMIEPGRDRMWLFLSGVVFVGYGIYVASQDSGVYFFSPLIFVIPVGAAIWAGVMIYGSGGERKASGDVSPSTTPSRTRIDYVLAKCPACGLQQMVNAVPLSRGLCGQCRAPLQEATVSST